ncbi:MAG: NAD(P)-binding protein, partial [Rhodospirillaceae bacterium]|nr:NAD(P)-binding protein [Rhodospirillaceae bacterium]
MVSGSTGQSNPRRKCKSRPPGTSDLHLPKFGSEARTRTMVRIGNATSDARSAAMPRRVAIVGGGISGLGVAWALHRHPDRFEFRLFEAQDQVGGNAVTSDMPQDDGTSIPFDISVTTCIPSVYHHILLLMQQHGIELVDTRFSYSVKYRGGIYAHDFDSDIRRQLQPEIEKFQRLLRRLKWFGRLNRSRSRLLNALNPFNYVSMGTVLNFGRFSGDFRYKILKPMFVNFLMATNVFD